MFVESLALKQALGNANGIAVSLTNLGLVERDAGRPEAAAGAFEEAIAIWERTGDRQRVAVGRPQRRACSPSTCAGYDEAARHARPRLRHRRASSATGRRWPTRSPTGRGSRSSAATSTARPPRSRASLPAGRTPRRPDHRPARARGRRLRSRPRAATTRSRSGCGPPRPTRATVSGFANMPADERLLDARMAEVRERLDPGTVAAAWAEGQALTLDAAVEAAMTLVGDRRRLAAG